MITCSALEGISNGIVSSLTKPPFKVGDRAYFTCLKGYRLNQDYGFIDCNETGVWNPSPPVCVGKYRNLWCAVS